MCAKQFGRRTEYAAWSGGGECVAGHATHSPGKDGLELGEVGEIEQVAVLAYELCPRVYSRRTLLMEFRRV